MFFSKWLELFRGLRRNHIVMPVKIEQSLTTAKARQQADRSIVEIVFESVRRKPLDVEIQIDAGAFQGTSRKSDSVSPADSPWE